MLKIAKKHNLKVFPKKWTDFKMQCSCLDWAVPCKHLAAVVYKVSAEIDNDPFLVFKLHQLDLLKAFESRGIYIKTENTAIPKIIHLYFDKQPKEINYQPQFAYQKLPFAKLDNLQEPLIKFLTDYPVFYQANGNFKDKYAIKISKCAKLTRHILQGKKLWIVYLLRHNQNH